MRLRTYQEREWFIKFTNVKFNKLFYRKYHWLVVSFVYHGFVIFIEKILFLCVSYI